MSIAALIRRMAEAGATPEAIAIAVEAIEGAQAVDAARRAKRAEQKRNERAAAKGSDNTATVARQSRDNTATVADIAPDKESLPHTPSKEINPDPSLRSGLVLARECERELIDDGVTSEALDAWKGVRRAKRAGPINRLVVDRMRREAAKAGISTAQAVTICVERGWQSLDADWLANPSARAGPASPAQPRKGSAGIFDALKKIEREMENGTGANGHAEFRGPVLRISGG